ncbi:hypothetical protein [Calidifontibacter indicus]|uniref:hypothetical protein n=1 Tax=Calidifontibacter indicus TaxID=419650 RepID=UPI003D73B395
MPKASNRTEREWLVQLGWAAIDCTIIIAGAFFAAWIRFDLNIRDANIGSVRTSPLWLC